MSAGRGCAYLRAGIANVRPVVRIVWRSVLVFAIVGAIAWGLGRNAAVLLVQLLVLALLVFRAGQSLRNPRQRIVLRGIRPRHFALALRVLAGVLVAVLVLLAPNTILRWGWWESLGGTGNVIFAQSSHPAEWISRVALPILIVIALLVSLSLFALHEERAFRRGDEARGTGERLWRSLLFGLAHLVMGIPIGAALGLGVGGFGFSQAYRRRWRESGSRLESVLESARVHFAYNLVLVSLVAVMLIGAALVHRSAAAGPRHAAPAAAATPHAGPRSGSRVRYASPKPPPAAQGPPGQAVASH